MYKVCIEMFVVEIIKELICLEKENKRFIKEL